MLPLLGGVFLGWSLGANDASNIFGTAVSSKMVRFGTAAAVAAVFVIIGAVVSGQAGIDTLKGLTTLTLEEAVISSVAAAITVTLMTLLGLPVSTSQSVVGAILGMGVLQNQLNMAGLGKVVACWLGTPVGGAVITFFLYYLLAAAYNGMNLNLFESDSIIRKAMLIAGAYGAFALGANNVANVTAVFVGADLLTVSQAAWIGGGSIALGIVTFSRRVMGTVGSKLVRLDPFSALVVVIGLAVTVHIYTVIGVPVSTSQAVIGGVLGIGIVKGVKTVSFGTLYRILFGWFLTPLVAFFLSLTIYFVLHLEYVPG